MRVKLANFMAILSACRKYNYARAGRLRLFGIAN